MINSEDDHPLKWVMCQCCDGITFYNLGAMLKVSSYIISISFYCITFNNNVMNNNYVIASCKEREYNHQPKFADCWETNFSGIPHMIEIISRWYTRGGDVGMRYILATESLWWFSTNCGLLHHVLDMFTMHLEGGVWFEKKIGGMS